ncbi:MAG: C4-dicarboxylate ABC transporter substrate-binding protein [Betaproteobacteria bacterium HGW-Betaproteobacteria-13]|jgi:tripartite ATP-independent transporter DctP family solute receptor|uniref:C4-dicarboxylate ABC transporter substrate-binding protein n=1 Tax=Parazoarcus communis TaxID=41977 RepID=A0A2U8H291_9RHOO|nr:DctP family TRAP transporter solute-binding subunit [Parazoarcus communis]AWI79296.1 C4-dicarboxylate ABC transporter substrate-binding protein [Parazoarcus communis]PKO81954.1 MAG: C4-dicarboxylate ABC transporter substrate-binding protein [Betaproteobacteria bacterium HGW-Betaproteobacteria-13]
MKLKTLLTAVATTMVFAVAPAHAEKILKIHHLNVDDPFESTTGALVTVFKNLVEAGTGGSVKVQTFPSGQLGKDNEVLSQVKAGLVQSGVFSVGGFASTYPMIGVLDMPFVFPDISTTYTVLDGPFGQKLGDDIEKKTGMEVLGFGDSGGFFAITNSKRAIKTPADMKGLKIRTQTLESHKRVISSLGGQPAAIAWAEVYTALQTGVADGQMNPIPIVAMAKFNEVQKHITLTDHLFAPYVWVINRKFFDSLTPEEQVVVKNAAKSAIVANRGISRIIEASSKGLPELAKTMTVTTLTPKEKAAFRDAAQPAVKAYIVDTFGKEGEEMLGALQQAVEAASK